MINPDGVYHGHYRSDTRGVNLNRAYGVAQPGEHPAVFAITSLVRQLHERGELLLYVDCHAHSNKRGCFLFGNALADAQAMADSVLYAKLVEQNCRWLDFGGCVFSEANMRRKDRRDGAIGKEGSGRVTVHGMTGLTYVFTLECNYNMGRLVNRLVHPHAPEGSDAYRSLSPQPPLRCLSPKYTPESWRAVGKALAVAALDLLHANPCSRLGAPGDEFAVGMSRLRSTAVAWVRSNNRPSKAKAPAGSAQGEGEASDGGSETEAEEASPPSELRKVDPEPEQVLCDLRRATPPYWVQVDGTPLLRQGYSLKTPPAGRLESNSQVAIVGTRAMKDGSLRAAVGLGPNGNVCGWMTLVTNQGLENATYLIPQPEAALLPLDTVTSNAGMDPIVKGRTSGGILLVI